MTSTIVCVHRGNEIREERCPPCGDHVRIKVFACAVHRECTVGTLIPGITCCAYCPDFTAAPKDAPETKTADSR